MKQTVEQYMEKGLERRMAEYFASGRKTIIGVVPNNDFTLIISFDNGEKRKLDMNPMLEKGTVFEPLIQMEIFQRVYVDTEHCVAWDIDPDVDSTVVWNNKIDLCPDTCYVDSVPLVS